MTVHGPRQQRFDALYRERPDPWGLESHAYEREKLDATMQAIGRRRFIRALEVGCAIGVQTARLAAICEAVLALDVSTVALRRARDRVPTANFLHAEVPGQWPQDAYDLILLSEVLYFLEPGEIVATARHVARDLAPGGLCIVVNWTGPNDCTLDGDAAAAAFLAELGAHAAIDVRQERHPSYRIDVVARKAWPTSDATLR